MKIVHICHLYYPSAGGVQTYFKNVSERLVKDYDDDVTIVTTDSYYGPERLYFKKVAPAQEVINGVKILRFSYRRWHLRPFQFVYKLMRVLKLSIPDELILRLKGPYSPGMKNYLTTVKADAFFASSSYYYFMQLPLWRKCNFFYFASIHLEEDEKENHILKKQLESMNASTLYIANTHFEKQRMAKLGVNADKIFVLGCGVDMAPFEQVSDGSVKNYKVQLGLPDNALIIGYVGRIEKTKNIRLVIEAFEKIYHQHPDAYLLIAGSVSDYVSELKDQCNLLPLVISQRIKFLTGFAPTEKSLLFNCLDILVLASKNESFGLVFLEAWSCKKPVIGASIGAVRDVINDNENGLIAKVGDSNDLAEKMSKLLADETLRKKFGENGYRKVKENYTWDIIVSRLRTCYENAVENHQIKVIN